jgi:hypothetical protein
MKEIKWLVMCGVTMEQYCQNIFFLIKLKNGEINDQIKNNGYNNLDINI